MEYNNLLKKLEIQEIHSDIEECVNMLKFDLEINSDFDFNEETDFLYLEYMKPNKKTNLFTLHQN